MDCDPISGQCHCVDGHMGPTCRQGELGFLGREREGTVLSDPHALLAGANNHPRLYPQCLHGL